MANIEEIAKKLEELEKRVETLEQRTHPKPPQPRERF